MENLKNTNEITGENRNSEKIKLRPTVRHATIQPVWN